MVSIYLSIVYKWALEEGIPFRFHKGNRFQPNRLCGRRSEFGQLGRDCFMGPSRGVLKSLGGVAQSRKKSLPGRFCFKMCWKRYFFLCCCLKNTLWRGQKETAQVVFLYSSIKLQVLLGKGFLYRKYNPKSGLYRYPYIFLSFFSSCVFVTRIVQREYDFIPN